MVLLGLFLGTGERLGVLNINYLQNSLGFLGYLLCSDWSISWLNIVINFHLLVTPLCIDRGRDKNSSVLVNAVCSNLRLIFLSGLVTANQNREMK